MLTGAARHFAPSERNGVASITALTVTPGPGRTVVSMRQGDQDFVVDAGSGEWIEGDAVAASGGAQPDGALAFDVIFVETPHRLRIVAGGPDMPEETFEARWVTEPLHPLSLAQMRMPRV
jgi:hypothetical protein